MVKPSPSHILIVEDDAKVRLLLRRCFEGEGFRVSEVGSGADAIERVAAGTFDLVTLDLQLPDGDGFAVGREIRSRSAVPIIMVTGKGDTIDRVAGLELGADDYITKPFQLREVVARVRAVLRRTASSGQRTGGASAPCGDGTLAFEGWVLDVPKRELRLAAGAVCDLTTSEFDQVKARLIRLTRGRSINEGKSGPVLRKHTVEDEKPPVLHRKIGTTTPNFP